MMLIVLTSINTTAFLLFSFFQFSASWRTSSSAQLFRPEHVNKSWWRSCPQPPRPFTKAIRSLPLPVSLPPHYLGWRPPPLFISYLSRLPADRPACLPWATSSFQPEWCSKMKSSPQTLLFKILTKSVIQDETVLHTTRGHLIINLSDPEYLPTFFHRFLRNFLVKDSWFTINKYINNFFKMVKSELLSTQGQEPDWSDLTLSPVPPITILADLNYPLA